MSHFFLLCSRSCTLAHHWHSRLIKTNTKLNWERFLDALFHHSLALFIFFLIFLLNWIASTALAVNLHNNTVRSHCVCNWSSGTALCSFMCLHYFRWKNSLKRKALLLHCTKNAGVVWYSVYDLSVTTFILAKKRTVVHEVIIHFESKQCVSTELRTHKKNTAEIIST